MIHGQLRSLPRQKEYCYLYSALLALLDATYHSAAIASWANTPDVVVREISATLELIFSIQVALVGRHKGLTLISQDPQGAALVDLALEGSAGDLPAPTVGALTGLTK